MKILASIFIIIILAAIFIIPFCAVLKILCEREIQQCKKKDKRV